jgi:hypothetical protein
MKAKPNTSLSVGVCAVLSVINTCGLQIAHALNTAGSFEEEARNKDAVIDHLRPVLYSANKAARIYYGGHCPRTEPYIVMFPRVKVRQPVGSTSDVGTIRSMFRDEREATVTEDHGVIRIRIGIVPDAILQTKLADVDLDADSQYDPFMAISSLEKAPEVRSNLSHLNLRQSDRPILIGTQRPAEGLPHLPAHVSNLTMDEALDLVARTWGGIVTYGTCGPPKIFEISFSSTSSRTRGPN